MRDLVPTVLGDRGIEWIRDFVVCGPYEEGGALCAAVARTAVGFGWPPGVRRSVTITDPRPGFPSASDQYCERPITRVPT